MLNETTIQNQIFVEQEISLLEMGGPSRQTVVVAVGTGLCYRLQAGYDPKTKEEVWPGYFADIFQQSTGYLVRSLHGRDLSEEMVRTFLLSLESCGLDWQRLTAKQLKTWYKSHQLDWKTYLAQADAAAKTHWRVKSD